jgi:methylphosphotriester-DNA--protein-cysteine methyltransferase
MRKHDVPSLNFVPQQRFHPEKLECPQSNFVPQQRCHPERSLARFMSQTKSKDLRLLFVILQQAADSENAEGHLQLERETNCIQFELQIRIPGRINWKNS